MLGAFHPVLRPMPKAPAEELESFLRRQDAPSLADVLIELANEHEAAQARLARMQMADRPRTGPAGSARSLGVVRELYRGRHLVVRERRRVRRARRTPAASGP